MKTKTIIMLTAFSCLLGVVAVPGYAAIYKYIDKDGVPCFADDLQSVPEQFRGTAIIVEGESNEEEAVMPDTSPSVPAEAPAAGPAPQYQGKRTRPLSSRLMISAAVGSSAVLLFIIVVARQSGLHLDNKILSRFRAGLIALVSLYLVFAHARDVMIIFGFAGRAIEDVQQQSAEKGKKAVEAMKTIDALFEEAQKAGQISGTIVTDEDRKQ